MGQLTDTERVEKCRKACFDKMSKFEKEEYKIKARETKKVPMLQRKQSKKILALPQLHLPLLLPPVHLISVHKTPSHPMERL